MQSLRQRSVSNQNSPASVSSVLNSHPAATATTALLCAGLFSALLFIVFPTAFNIFEERIGELGWTLAPDMRTEERITIVSIDEKSLAEVGPWPWSRIQMAALVRAIDAAGAQLQLHDIVYPEGDKPGDAEFLAALQDSRGAVLAQIPLLESNQVLRSGTMSSALGGINCAAGLPSTTNFLAQSDLLAPIAKGHIATIVSSDGAMRQQPALICVDGAAYPAFALTPFLQNTSGIGAPEYGAHISSNASGLLGPEQTLTLDSYPGLAIPLDANGNLRISYRSDPSVFRAVSAIDVLNGTADTSLLENAWVLVGGTAFGINDIVPTPYSGVTHGVELQARILASLLDMDVPYTPSGKNWLLGGLILLFAGVLFVLAYARGRFASIGLPLATLVMPLVAVTLHIQLLAAANIWLGWIYPAIYGVLGGSLLLLVEQARVRLERSRVFGNLNSYLPADVAKQIAYSLPSSSINARRCNVTLLCADLRNFSGFGESRPPEESAAVLHYFYTRGTQIVEQHGGHVQEFKGDSLLAIWEGHDAQAATQALAAANDMQAALHYSLLPGEPPAGLEPLGLGIGIEQGPALIGSIGPAHRRAHTLLGETVGITLRIQEMTAELAQPILIGECAARQLGDLNLESQGSYLLAGLMTPHVLFAPAPEVRLQQQAKLDQPRLRVLRGGRN